MSAKHLIHLQATVYQWKLKHNSILYLPKAKQFFNIIYSNFIYQHIHQIIALMTITRHQMIKNITKAKYSKNSAVIFKTLCDNAQKRGNSWMNIHGWSAWRTWQYTKKENRQKQGCMLSNIRKTVAAKVKQNKTIQQKRQALMHSFHYVLIKPVFVFIFTTDSIGKLVVSWSCQF